MAEWFKAHAWKVCVLSKVPWVRIPLSPPFFELQLNNFDIVDEYQKILVNTIFSLAFYKNDFKNVLVYDTSTSNVILEKMIKLFYFAKRK